MLVTTFAHRFISCIRCLLFQHWRDAPLLAPSGSHFINHCEYEGYGCCFVFHPTVSMLASKMLALDSFPVVVPLMSSMPSSRR